MRNSDTWCRHRTPFTKEIKACKAGVDFHQFEGTADYANPSMMPCLGECSEARARCDKYSGLSPEELAAKEEKFKAGFARIGAIRQAIIKNIADTKSRQGQMPCPCCKTGTVGYSQASNGHVHARCSTDGCASWME